MNPLEKNRRHANTSKEWEYELNMRDLHILAILQSNGRTMTSAKILRRDHGFDVLKNNLKRLKSEGYIEKFNNKQWQLTDKGKRWEP